MFFVPFVCAAQEPLGDAREVPGVPDIVLDAAKSRLFKPGGCDSLRLGCLDVSWNTAGQVQPSSVRTRKLSTYLTVQKTMRFSYYGTQFSQSS